MTGIIIKGYTLSDHSIDVQVLRQGKLTIIPVVRTDYEKWAEENNKVMWDYQPLTLDVYWNEFHPTTIHRHLEEFIIVKGLVGDPMKDTFSALQDICNTYKRPTAGNTTHHHQNAL